MRYAMTSDLITLEAYKEYKGLKNTDKDGRRSLLIGLVSKLVKTYCGRTFIDHVLIDKVEYFDARTPEVVLAEWPVISVTSVKTSIDGGTTQITLTEGSVDLDGFYADVENSKVFTQVESYNFLDVINHPYKSLEVTYLAGYTEDDDGVTAHTPEDIRLALFDLVAYYENNEKSLNKTMASATIDNPTPKLSNDFPAHIKRILDLYRMIDI